MVWELLEYSLAGLGRDPGMGGISTKSTSGYAWFYFTPLPQASLGSSVKTKNPTGNPIGLILLWELLDSNQ